MRIEGTSCPATRMTTANHNDRVVPEHSFKIANVLQECRASVAPMLIRMLTNAEHGPMSTTHAIEFQTDMFAFAWENMGFKPDFSEVLKD